LVDLAPSVVKTADRKDYKYPEIVQHVKEHRGELVWAVLTLIAHWLAENRPTCDDDALLASYGPFCRAVGGVLKAAGIGKFNMNRVDLQKLVGSVEGDPHADAIEAWVRAHLDQPGVNPLSSVLARHLVGIWAAQRIELPAKLKRSKADDEFDLDPRKVAFWLGTKEGALFEVGGKTYKLEQGEKAEGGRPWSLVPIRANSSAPAG
jgi:hypothetical protein